MPFTGGHPAIVLPLGRWLPVPALVIGSMVPDLPYFFPMPFGSGLTHSWLGVCTVDVVLGLAVCVLWSTVRPLYVPAVLVGAFSHFVWDSFTHENQWGTRHLGWLAAVHGPLPGYQWTQYASSVAGALVVTWYVARRRPAVPWWAVVGVGVSTVVGVVSLVVFADVTPSLFAMVSRGVGFGLVAGLVCRVAWRVANRGKLRDSSFSPGE